jgi:uncharacterized protein YsxB (DUF464 family)
MTNKQNWMLEKQKIKEYFLTKEFEINNKIKEIKKMELGLKMKSTHKQLHAIKKEYEDYLFVRQQ